MAEYILEPVVLCGVSPRKVEMAVVVRLGSSYPATKQPPAVTGSSVFPVPVDPRGFIGPDGRPNHADNQRMGEAAQGTGRSLREMGTQRHCASAARSAARAVLAGTARTRGGCKPMTAKRLWSTSTRRASAGSGTPWRVLTGLAGWAAPAVTWGREA
jgi:hypothetical protein